MEEFEQASILEDFAHLSVCSSIYRMLKIWLNLLSKIPQFICLEPEGHCLIYFSRINALWALNRQFFCCNTISLLSMFKISHKNQRLVLSKHSIPPPPPPSQKKMNCSKLYPRFAGANFLLSRCILLNDSIWLYLGRLIRWLHTKLFLGSNYFVGRIGVRQSRIVLRISEQEALTRG